MSRRYDAIVVGGGHNGLTTAALLAKAGRKTLIVERRELLGGLAAGEEFHPGYRTAGLLHETAGVRGWVVDALGLEAHGLRRMAEPPPIFVPQRAADGDGLLLWRDPQRAADELSRGSARDRDGYRTYRDFVAAIQPVIRRLTDHAPPEILAPQLSDLVALGRSALGLRLLGRGRMMELLRVAPMAVADWLGEIFESPLVQAALAAPAIHHTYTGPRSPASVVNLLLAECTTERAIAGGGAALVAALEEAARAHGVEIETGAPVEQLLLASGAGTVTGSTVAGSTVTGSTVTGSTVTGVRLASGEEIEATVVAASCDPKHLFLQLMPPAALSRGLEHEISHLRARGTTAKVHLALSEYPSWNCRPELRPAAIRIGESLDELERAFDAVKYRRISDEPILDIHVPTVDSPELAPPGHHVLSILVHFAPYQLGGDELERGWGAERHAELYGRVLDRLRAYAPGLESSIVGHEVLSPRDLEDRYGVTGGHLHHAEHALDQLLVRPVPGCTRYATPFPGLYLCGAGSHPGGGLTCAPGALAAQAILER